MKGEYLELMEGMAGHSGLLIIDVQAGIIEGLDAYHGREVLEQINKLSAKARAANIASSISSLPAA